MSRVRNMSQAFRHCKFFDQDIGNWDTSTVTDMSHMFDGAIAFNKPIGHWNTSKVTDMRCMFEGASAFNGPIGLWNTSNVENMSHMFYGASAFNQPLGGTGTRAKWGQWMLCSLKRARSTSLLKKWNTGNVVSTNVMFRGASSFYQDISTWGTFRGAGVRVPCSRRAGSPATKTSPSSSRASRCSASRFFLLFFFWRSDAAYFLLVRFTLIAVRVPGFFLGLHLGRLFFRFFFSTV